MKKNDYVILFLAAMVVFSLAATLQKVPGYMDAEYYFGQAIHLAEGKGLNEPFLWNYLNDPSTIPTPAFSFWMPLTSFLASTGLWFFHSTNYLVARLPFGLLAAIIPLLTAYFADQLLPGKRAGWLAGGLALFSGFYLPFITITDNFTLFMALGGIFFFIVHQLSIADDKKYKKLGFILIGITIGLMALTRSDGLFWLLAGFLAVFWINKNQFKALGTNIIGLIFVIIGFSLIMTPWYFRNLSVYHSILPYGNRLMLWLNEYNDLFVYPSNLLNYLRWIDAGFSNILLDRLSALGSNLQTLFAAGGAIVLSPLMLLGYWKHRKKLIYQLGGIMLLVILIVMSIIFPYAGERGGFFHSLSSIQVLLWALVPAGLEVIIQWGIRHRNWKTNRSWIMFSIALIASVGSLSVIKMVEKLNNGVENGIPWNESLSAFSIIEQRLDQLNVDKNEIIMVNDPPGFSLATGRPSVMIPSSGAESIIEVCERYHVSLLALNDERLDVSNLLMTNAQFRKRFKLIFDEADTQVYEFNP